MFDRELNPSRPAAYHTQPAPGHSVPQPAQPWPNTKFTNVCPPPSVPCADCPEPVCTPQLTEQCTDQCIVIACSDPGHEGTTCGGSNGDAHCDFVCDSGMNCTDCNGFDAFLQCCTEHHSRPATAKYGNALENTAQWDSALNDFLCACGQAPTSQKTDPEYSHAIPGIVPPPTPVPDNFHNLNSSPLSPPSQLQHIPYTNQWPMDLTTNPIPQRPEPTLACRWSNCDACFNTLSELVGHVNLHHLAPPIAMRSDPLSHQDKLFCLWRDCDVYPSASSIPTPSSGDQLEAMLSTLTNHLLQDHLGLQANYLHDLLPLPREEVNDHSEEPMRGPDKARDIGFWTAGTPGNTTATASDSDSLKSPTSNKSPGPSPSMIELPNDPPPNNVSAPAKEPHSCSGIHACRWQNCTETFDSCDSLTAHINSAHVGSGKAQYECFWEGCSRHGHHGFTSKQKICRHLQSHTGHRPFQCTICQMYFSEAATLQQHMRRHTQERPYVCDFPGCNKSFAITGALTIHKRTHNGHKPFKCTYCDRAFAESSNLSKHLRTHTGARPYLCTEVGCGKTFARPDQLTRHLGVHRKRNAPRSPTDPIPLPLTVDSVVG